MIYEAHEFLLKDGTKVIIKSPDISDGPKLLANIIAISASTDFLLSVPEDYDIYLKDMKKEEDFISSFTDNDSCLLCAYIADKIIANCMLRVHTHVKDRHRADIGIAIAPDYQNRGLGSLLFDELIKIAKSLKYVEQLELDVVKINERAKHLYQNKGFVKVGDIPHDIRLKDGTYLDSEKMILFLK